MTKPTLPGAARAANMAALNVAGGSIATSTITPTGVNARNQTAPAAASTTRRASDLKLLCGVTTVSERTKKAIYIAVMGVNIAYYLTLILIASSIFNRCLDWLVSVW